MGKRRKDVEGIPWIENCFPLTIDDLAVQKKKVLEVEDWLQNCFKQQKKNTILLLTGPPGAGKTATVTLLCKTLKAEVISWNNMETEFYQNGNADIPSVNYERQWVKRENQVSQFNSFLLRCNKYSLFEDERKVILVEEFPNAFLRDPSLFHEIISLRPITVAKLLKALIKINDTIQFQSCYKKLSKSQLEDIATNSMGDIRNAINSLQFLSISSFKRPKPVGQAKGKSLTEKEKSQENVRDNSLFLFHALGKILYCKRDKSTKEEKDALPTHLKHLERDPPLANAEEVFERTSLSAEAFSLFLHENFLAFMSDINVVADSLHWFSESDTLTSFWNGQDSLNEYVASLASRGLMFNMMPSSGNSWRPLHKPHHYECFKKKASLMASLKRSFRDKSVTFRILQTELLPYMQKINCTGLKPDQSAIVSEIGEMKVKRSVGYKPDNQTLKEKEVLDLDIDDFETVCDADMGKNDPLDVVEVPDEEIIIEEYDF